MMKSSSPQFRLSGGGGRYHVSRPLVLLFCGVTLVWLYCFASSSWPPTRQSPEQLRGQLLDLSEKYVKSLASETSDVVDGPYTGRLTGYDLKKTLAVLLQDLLERVHRLEKVVFARGAANQSANASAAGDEAAAQVMLLKG